MTAQVDDRWCNISCSSVAVGLQIDAASCKDPD